MGATGKEGKRRREVGWAMDIEKTCLDQATFEVGAHNVRGGGVTSKNPQEAKYSTSTKRKILFTQTSCKVSSTEALHLGKKKDLLPFTPLPLRFISKLHLSKIEKKGFQMTS